MIRRRQFLECLTALGGSYVLSACGGGGGGGSSNGAQAQAQGQTAGTSSNVGGTGASTSTATGSTLPATSTTTTASASTSVSASTSSSSSVPANGVPTTSSSGSGSSSSNSSSGSSSSSGSHSSATNNSPMASADGTAMPPATSIIDNQNAVWTLSNGYVSRNGLLAGNNYNVTLVLWIRGIIYSQGTGGQFYGWNGTIWLACNDPRLGGTSTDGTAIPPAPYIIDRVGALWTVVNGAVYRDNTPVGVTSNVALLLWYGGKLWYQDTGGQFHVCNDVDQWLPCRDPRTAVAATPGMFYGINGHYDYTYSPSQLVSFMRNLGCSTYRVGCTDDPVQLNAVVAIARAFQSAGLTLFVLIDSGLQDSNGNFFASESAAYNRSLTCGATVAAALAPYGVTMYECGNELTRANGIVVDSATAGTKAIDFNNANWPVMRGAMRGMIDGVKSRQPTAKCGINFCVADTGASDMLWDGLQPDGSSGYPTVRWDLTTWHNYEVYGDIFDIGADGNGPAFDLPTYCKARYGVPFLITEWNTGPEKSESYRANYVATQLASFYSARKTHNLQAAMYYVLDSGDTTYGIMINGVPIALPYNAFTSFTAAHADN
ncbi:hypothetical protein AAGS40_19720 [Paraburkholderia sp. PREW-6R]|uniref:hypothetical protein n=1 Tax=Paraburkholderia sp. PREW-6R TaxID=3141544 RepID=UPI0031F50185